MGARTAKRRSVDAPRAGRWKTSYRQGMGAVAVVAVTVAAAVAAVAALAVGMG